MRKSKSKATIIISAVLILAGVLSVFVLLTPNYDSESRRGGNSEGFSPTGDENGAFYSTDIIEPGESDTILDDVKKGRINLLSELRRLRSECPAEFTTEQCFQRIKNFLLTLEEPASSRLVKVLVIYQQYEKDQQRLGASNLTLAEKFRLIKEKRREMFGQEDGKLVFGLQEANFDYQNLLHKYSTGETAGMTAGEKLQAIESKRREIYGDYYETFKERQVPGSRYGLELLVRQSEFQNMDSEAQRQVVQGLRVKYFGAEKAEQMEKVELAANKETKELNDKLQAFLTAEAEYIKNNPDVPVEERLKKIEEIRNDIYGN